MLNNATKKSLTRAWLAMASVLLLLSACLAGLSAGFSQRLEDMQPAAHDSYGYDATDPILLGGHDVVRYDDDHPSPAKRLALFLGAIAPAGGKILRWQVLGPCCDPTGKQNRLVLYRVQLSTGKAVTLYVDHHHSEVFYVPSGFHRLPGGTLPGS